MPMRRGYSEGRKGPKILIALGSMVAAVSLSGCAAMGDLGIGPVAEAPSESLPIATAATRPTAELEKATEYWGKQVAENPRDGTAALSYARNLKALGRKKEALAVLQTSYLYNAQNREFLSEYGRLALDQGQVSTAAQLLEFADDPAKPDWRILSARGTVLAKQGQYKEAIPFYEQARQLAPEQGSVLNNLAMAYTMDGQAEQAEAMLRQATQMKGGDERIQQNLALVQELQGKKGPQAARGDDKAEPGFATDPGEAPSSRTAGKALASSSSPVRAPKAEPAASSSTLDPDQIIRAALKAEAEKEKKARPKPTAQAKPATVAINDAAPPVRPTAQ